MITKLNYIFCLFILIFGTISCGSQSKLAITDPHIRADRDFEYAIYNDTDRLINDPFVKLNDKLSSLKNVKNLENLCKDASSTINIDSRKYCNSSAEQNHLPITDVFVIAHGWNYTLTESIESYQKYVDLINSFLNKNGFPNKGFHPHFVFVSWPSAVRPLSSLSEATLPLDIDETLHPIFSTIDHTAFFFPTVWKQSVDAYNTALGDMRSNGDNGNCIDLSTVKRFENDGNNVPVACIIYDLISKNRDQTNISNFKIHLVGHSFGSKLLAISAMKALAMWKIWHEGKSYNFQNVTNFPIESLILINPAFHINELESHKFSSKIFKNFFFTKNQENILPTTSDLKYIQRKAVVYSNYDYPNGTLFDITQLPINNFHAQWFQEFQRAYESWYVNLFGQTVFDIVAKPIITIGYLGYLIPYSVLDWTFSKAMDLPFDFAYHLKNNDTIPRGDNIFFDSLRYVFNGLHFFLPLDKFLEGGVPADQWGILRSSKSALGRTGLNKMFNGRIFGISGLEEYIDQSNPSSTEITSEVMCSWSKKVLNSSNASPIDNKFIYSIDGTTILDSWIPPLGAHGDIRSSNHPRKCPKLEKRQLMMNFIYNFTKKLNVTRS